MKKEIEKSAESHAGENPTNPGSVIAMIPARYAATRFPGKLMQMLGDKTVIRHTYEAALSSGLFDDVIVVTDSDIIQTEITAAGGHVIMSKNEHESGSDRIAEAADTINADIIVNVQGDEPFIAKEPLEKLIELFNDESVQVGSLMRKITEEEAADSNCVKVVTGKNGDALYFSRSTIPFNRSGDADYYLHVGVYAYRKEMLLDFTSWPATQLEQTEKLEQLRLLENGIKIRMAETDYQNIAIDTPENLADAIKWLSFNKKS
ncbi:MAG TPA: 3-deoxy-manno-octulosonate cytidylyltransferase [Chitinophagaceae bacterium]|nr:3-deoxy-manno-octulosonate cytidylyltransferase [Chitinophagaceae bacterium]